MLPLSLFCYSAQMPATKYLYNCILFFFILVTFVKSALCMMTVSHDVHFCVSFGNPFHLYLIVTTVCENSTTLIIIIIMSNDSLGLTRIGS